MSPHNPQDGSIAGAPSTSDERTDKELTLTLEAGTAGSAVVLHCQGRTIFQHEAQALSTIAAEVLPSAHRMVVDLAGVDSIDSGALGELVLTHMWAEAAGDIVMFASPRKSVRHFLETTNLLSVFDVYASVPEAIAAMVLDEAEAQSA